MKNLKSTQDYTGGLQPSALNQEDSFMNPNYYDLTDSDGQLKFHDLKTLAKYKQQKAKVVNAPHVVKPSSPASD